MATTNTSSFNVKYGLNVGGSLAVAGSSAMAATNFSVWPTVNNVPINTQTISLDTLTFNGATTAFSLTVGGSAYTPASATALLISIGGVLQQPNSAYTVSGSTITFSTAPPYNASFFGVGFTFINNTYTIAAGSVPYTGLTSGGPSWSTTGSVAAKNPANSYGYVALEPSANTTNTGYVSFWTNGGTRIGTIGNGATDLVFNTDSANNGIQLQVGGVQALRATPAAAVFVGSQSASWSGAVKLDCQSTSGSSLAWAISGYCAPAASGVTASGGAFLARVDATANSLISFYYTGSTVVGSITTTGTATAYNTSSDRRLKTGIVAMSGALERVMALVPRRFEFISDPGNMVDGFIADEAQQVVPEAVTGTKDEVDADGNPHYQSIDHSKLVPVLTGAIQDLSELVKALSARMTSMAAQINALQLDVEALRGDVRQ